MDQRHHPSVLLVSHFSEASSELRSDHTHCEPAVFLRYSWRSTEWSECRVDVLLSQQDRRRGNQTSLCGGGIQTREVYCVQISSDPGSLKTKEGNFATNVLQDTYVVY